MDLPELMTVRDFLDAFSVSKTTFYKEVAAGRLHMLKVGKSTKIARVDAEAWLEELRGPRPMNLPHASRREEGEPVRLR
jgi:excisionase family DNA binding protein